MTPRKLEILQKRLEKAADDFRGMQFYCSVFYEDVLNKEIEYSHIPDKCIFKDIRWDGEGKPYEITDQIIDCWPEHYSEGPLVYTHKPMILENGDEFAAYLVRPYEADWNTSFALTTLDILCNEIFPFVLEAVISETSPWKIYHLFSSYENGELNYWLNDMNL